MNYYYPYLNMYPYTNFTNPGIFSRLINGFKGINFSSILSGTNKTLNVVNQTIPLVKQVTPIMKNAKTMFKVMNEFKRVNTPISKNNTVIQKKEKINKNNPTFFQ